MKKSLIISHIANCDYPLWRAWLDKYQVFFDEIVIYFDLSFRYPIFSSFIQSSLSHLPNIKFLDPVEGTGDWRHKATTQLLAHATGDWIVSIEQDWFSKDWDNLLLSVEKEMKSNDLIGWHNKTNFPYIHPAFFYIKRELLEKTKKDFSAHPEIDGADHFAMITKDTLEAGGKMKTLQDMGYETNIITPEETDCFHLGGVNQNILNGDRADYKFHRPEMFATYNYYALQADIIQSPLYKNICEKLATILPAPDYSWKGFFT